MALSVNEKCGGVVDLLNLIVLFIKKKKLEITRTELRVSGDYKVKVMREITKRRRS